MSTTPLTLTAAVSPRGGAALLFNGDIELDGLRLEHVNVVPQIAAYRRMVRGLEFDICELAPTTYLCARAFGREFTAIPVSLSRGFHHRSIVCNANSHITEPRELEGKRFGVRAYTVTTAVWARGILQAEYGVDPSSIAWYTDDEEHVQEWVPPSNVIALPGGESLATWIAAGKLDAALTGAAGIGRSGPPTANWEHAEQARSFAETPLFPNAAELEADWYRRTKIFPFHGLIVIKNSVLDAYPWVAPALLRAFQAAKKLYLDRLASKGPETADDRLLLENQALIGGDDPLPVGLAANRPTFEAMIAYARAQDIIPEKVAPEAVLAPQALELL
jgi:4,5-dihydroxyphthalate decarboxylase